MVGPIEAGVSSWTTSRIRTIAPKKGAYTGHRGLISVEASAEAIVESGRKGGGGELH